MGGLGTSRSSPAHSPSPRTRPSAWRGPQRQCSRGGTSLRPLPPTEPLPAGNAGLARPEGAWAPSPWVTFPRPGTWARPLPRIPAGGTRRPTLGVLVPRPGYTAEAAASSRAGPGGGALRAGSPGSSPLRRPSSRRLAGQANHHGPMTTRPDPSRPGPRETTEGELEAASLLSPPPLLQRQLPGSTRHLLTSAFPSPRPYRTAPNNNQRPHLDVAGEILCTRRLGTRDHRGRGDPGSREHGNRSPIL